MEITVFNDILARYSDPVFLKKGGQKIVFRAFDSKYGDVTVKVGMVDNPRQMEYLRREVDTLRGITSEYFPKNHSFEVIDNNTRFVIVEEYIVSKPLSHLLNDFQDEAKVIRLAQHLVEALMILWSMKVIHRDFKPDNILIKPDGNPSVIDLGIARLLEATSLTHSFALLGPCTPFYAAPEQLRNQKNSIDFRTDQFTLGIVLLQLLMGGVHPFDPAVVKAGDSIAQNIISNCYAHDFVDTIKSPILRHVIPTLLGSEMYMRYRKADYLKDDLLQANKIL